MELDKESPAYRRIRRLMTFIVERYCPFRVSTFQILLGFITTALLGSVLVLAWMSFTKVKDVVTNDFNQQQLVLAQHAARQIDNNLNTLKRQLTLLSLSPSIQYFEVVSIGKRMGITFSVIKEEGALEIRYVEHAGRRTFVTDDHGFQTVAPDQEDLSYLDWASDMKNKGEIRFSPIVPIIHGGSYLRHAMKIAVPVWRVSVDEMNPVATNDFSGVLLFVIDATAVTEKVTREIRSGKTGYGWVIDEKGTFLFHPEREFIGKNAFEARKEKKPTISFARINSIQKDMMLAGKEGTSWYISGWHRGKEGEMKKLIAYAPVRLSQAGGLLWSIAVVAPISEVEDAIHSIHVRQFVLQGLIIIVILLGGLAVSSLMTSWSVALEREVEKKTIEFKKSEQRYKSLVENAEDIIFTVDYNGIYLSINTHGARFFGKTPEEIVDRSLSDIIASPEGEEMLMTVKEVFDAKKGRQLTHSIRLGEQEHWLNTNFRRLFDEEGNIYAVLGISRDITARKKLEESSYHTEKLASMGTLAAGVAHEINNPLGIILGFTDMLLEKKDPASQEYDMLQTIERHGLRAKRVVENLLSFARYKEHKEELIDVNRNIETVLSVIGNTLLMNKISVQKRLADGMPAVKGCADELQQVFFNIITNAISAMGGGGFLTITTRELPEQRVRISLADTGCGIRKEHRTRIFDPLFTTKRIGEGTGLGLSVSYGIIMKHGGTIHFETKTREESEVTGTIFVITLPAVQNSKGEHHE